MYSHMFRLLLKFFVSKRQKISTFNVFFLCFSNFFSNINLKANWCSSIGCFILPHDTKRLRLGQQIAVLSLVNWKPGSCCSRFKSLFWFSWGFESRKAFNCGSCHILPHGQDMEFGSARLLPAGCNRQNVLQ